MSNIESLNDEREEFLTEADFFETNPDISKEEIDSINNHPTGPSENILPISRIVNTEKTRDESVFKKKVIERGQINQIGFLSVIGDIETRDYKVISFDRFGKPKYKKEVSVHESIIRNYLQIRARMNEENDNRHIFLIKKGLRIEGCGKDKRFSGILLQPILAVYNKNGKSLNPIYSFNSQGENNFAISYTKSGSKKIAALSRDTGFLDYNRRIDLDKAKTPEERIALISGIIKD